MTPDRIDHTPEGEAENGVLADTGSLDTSALGILGGITEQVSVSLPTDEDVDLDDDGVIDDEVDPEVLEAIQSEYASIDDDEEDAVEGVEIVVGEFTGEIETNHSDVEESAEDASEIIGEYEPVETSVADGDLVELPAGEQVLDEDAHDQPAHGTGEPDASDDVERPADDTEPASPAPHEAAPHDAVAREADPHDAAAQGAVAGEPDLQEAESVTTAAADSIPPEQPLARREVLAPASPPATPAVVASVPATATQTSAPVDVSAVTRAPTGSVPATRREAMHPELVERSDRIHAVERTHVSTDVALASKRLGEFEAGRESPDLLTADRLLDPHQVSRPEPEGTWQHLVYSLTGHRVNLGDGKQARDRKELDRRIAVALPGAARFVPVLSRKGGVGKTTVTTLLGMALADARDDRIIAIDANPDRGTLAERIARTSGKTIRDLVRAHSDIAGYSDMSSIVARDETRLDVLASDTDPRVSEALSDRDYHDVAAVAAHYYSIVLTDTGTGIVHSVMGATLDLADQLVIVSGLSVDEARLASETLTWLETNGYSEQARNAIVVLNNARPGAPLVRQDELESHFRTRVRAVVRMPYDSLIGTGSAIAFRDLQPATRLASRELAAVVVQGLRSLAPAA